MLTIAFLKSPPGVVVNGFRIETAPSVAELQAAIGPADWIDSGATPAPAGHRNQQIHVYDRLGLTFIEHHYTRRAQSVVCWFDLHEEWFRFQPAAPFSDTLSINGVKMPNGSLAAEFVRALPIQLTPAWRGELTYQHEGFGLFVSLCRHKLKSGRRSRTLRIMNISLSWPHDNWSSPAE